MRLFAWTYTTDMKKYLYCENGFDEKAEYTPGCWTSVEYPDDSDIDFLTQMLNIPESFIEDIADTDERPRIEAEDAWLLTILHIPIDSQQTDIPFITIPLGIITAKNAMVTVCFHHTKFISDFIQYSRHKNISIKDNTDLILHILYFSTECFLKRLRQINQFVNAAEKDLEKSIRNEDLLKLMNIQKSLVYFNTSIHGNEVVAERLKDHFPGNGELDTALLEDATIELEQASNTVTIYSELLTGTMDTFASIISNNVNAIMKRMTSLSITLAIPTLIASFYGMNVNINIGESPYAFTLIILLSAAISAITFILFRKIKWF